MVSALRALKAAGALDAMRIHIVLTGDEENPGEPIAVSRKDLIDAAPQSDVALEFEPGIRLNGKDYGSTSRRGATEWVLRTRGVSGHSGQVGSAAMGDGAAKELIRILSLFASELPEKYLTYNVGLMVAGASAQLNDTQTAGSAAGKLNIIAGEAYAIGDLRTISEEQAERAEAKMRTIVSKHLPKTQAEITIRSMTPPMAPERNRGLLALLNGINRDMGLPLMEELDPMRRGAGDISFVAKNLDSLTGFGSIGEGAHAPGEWVDLTSLPLQAKRCALMLLRLGSH
jgi:glutamate carboxypeptidase